MRSFTGIRTQAKDSFILRASPPARIMDCHATKVGFIATVARHQIENAGMTI
jgi:hypothetical protein